MKQLHWTVRNICKLGWRFEKWLRTWVLVFFLNKSRQDGIHLSFVNDSYKIKESPWPQCLPSNTRENLEICTIYNFLFVLSATTYRYEEVTKWFHICPVAYRFKEVAVWSTRFSWTLFWCKEGNVWIVLYSLILKLWFYLANQPISQRNKSSISRSSDDLEL